MPAQQRGGELLGKGRDGYVYYGPEDGDPPRSKCKDRSIKRGNRVAKSMIEEIAEKEWSTTERLRSNEDFFRKFAIFPIERCVSQDEYYSSILFSEYGGRQFKEVYDSIMNACRYYIRHKKYDETMDEYMKELSAENIEVFLKQLLKKLADLGKYLDTMNSEYGLWHNDVKGDNMVYTDDGDIKMIDFGTATTKDPKHRDSEGLEDMIRTLTERLEKISSLEKSTTTQKGGRRRTRRRRSA